MSKEQIMSIIVEAYEQGVEIYLTEEGESFLRYGHTEHTEGL